MEKRKKILWVLLFAVSGILYYLIFHFEGGFGLGSEGQFKKELVFVTRVIDGDTVELNDSRRVRMLGVNTPEKGRFGSNESIFFSKNMENKFLLLEYKEKDKYGRILGYLTLDGENLNEKILANGLAHLYYYEKDKYYDFLRKAEEEARQKGIGIWKESENSGCLTLIELKYKETIRCTNQEQIVLNNVCDPIKVLIKDDATHEYLETIQKGVFSKNFSCIFNDAGDSFFVWDDSGLLLFRRYP